jgi:hypothetical protein
MSNVKKVSAMQVPFVTTVSFADRDGMTVHLQYGVAAPSEREARSELARRRAKPKRSICRKAASSC